MTGQKGTFVYKCDGFDAVYNKTDSGYKFVSLINNKMSIQISFGNDALTEAQISEKFGKVVSVLFLNDTAKVDKALNEMSSAVSEAQNSASK